MYRIKVFYPGKTKLKFIREGVNHYLKLLGAYAKIELVELKEGHGDKQKVIKEESKSILNSVKGDFILLHKEGKILTSEEFANLIRDKTVHQFVIGGVYGVDENVVSSASFKLSLSKMTFPHELTRIILLEQIYRALTIIHGKNYHY
ncbi:MAG: 23S rRNA (pseudouridine(1915)-N(3))-methyltransferase RlmH [Thermodesulfovibrionaceae bacterium]